LQPIRKHPYAGIAPHKARIEQIVAAGITSQNLTAPPVCNAQVAHTQYRSTAHQADRVRDVRRAGAQAQASALRCVYAQILGTNTARR
jgi:hypothetical protein